MGRRITLVQFIYDYLKQTLLRFVRINLVGLQIVIIANMCNNVQLNARLVQFPKIKVTLLVTVVTRL